MCVKKISLMAIFCVPFMGVAMHCTQGLAQQATDAATDRPVHIAGGVMAGNLLTMKVPVLSAEADCAHVSSLVVLHVIVGKDGSVRIVEVLSGVPIIAEPVLNAVREWMYRPFLVNGRPVEVDTTITSRVSRNCPNP